MAFPSHVEVFHRLVPTSTNAMGDDMDVFRVIPLRLSRGIAFFLAAVGFPCPLAYFPIVVGPFLLLGVLVPTTDGAAL